MLRLGFPIPVQKRDLQRAARLRVRVCRVTGRNVATGVTAGRSLGGVGVAVCRGLGVIGVAVWERILGRIAGLRMRVLLQPAGQHPRPVAAGAVDVRLVGDGAGQREFSGIAVRILAVLRGQLRIAAVGMGMLLDFAEKLARAPGGSADRERRARR